jgi:hypothetical protein
MEQKRVPQPKPMQETISVVLPSRRFGSAFFVAPQDFSAAPSTTAAVVVFKNSRRDQRVFMRSPFTQLFIVMLLQMGVSMLSVCASSTTIAKSSYPSLLSHCFALTHFDSVFSWCHLTDGWNSD